MEKKIVLVVVLIVGDYCLAIKEGKYLTDYIVGYGYDAESNTWGSGTYFSANADKPKEKALMLLKAMDYLYSRVNADYIRYERLSEMATRFKDELFEWADEEEAMENLQSELDFDDNEIAYFELPDIE